jgi:hypothetical protein
MGGVSLALSLALLVVFSATSPPQVRLFSSDHIPTSAHYSVNCFLFHKSNP